MGDFNLPDDCTGEMVDAAFGTPDDDRTCETCMWCIEECCDMGVCGVKLKSEPQDFDSWQKVVNYIESARVDMQVDTCEKWEDYR